MSVFRVKLQNVQQGRLDLDPSTNPLAAGTAATYGNLGTAFTTSKQRQVWVAGPKRRYRLLVDGATFTDCNYWKQFAYPQCSYEKAFIEIVTDDGSVYSDVASENTFAKGGSGNATTDFSATVVDFVTTYGGAAKMLMVQNLDTTSVKLTGELNADTNVTFTLAAGATQIFNQGDLAITYLRLKGSATCAYSWMASIQSAPTS